MNSIIKKSVISLSLISFLLLTAFLFPIVSSQETEEDIKAMINAKIDGDIPSIERSNWTAIEIEIEDAFGLNWTFLQSQFNDLYMKLIWPFMFGKDVDKYLGYTTLRFKPDIVQGDPNGWELKVEPATISGTTDGHKHKVILYAQIDEFAADYSVVAGIKCTRILSNGEVEGESYINIPLKAAAFNYIRMDAIDSKKQTSPRSIVNFEIDITNRGFYEDVFMFEVKGDKEVSGKIAEAGLLLEAGETRTVTLSVLTPDKFYDPGTSYNIDIYVHSTSDPTKQYVGSVVVESLGFHINILAITTLVIVIILLIIIFYIIKNTDFSKKRLSKYVQSRSKKKKQRKEDGDKEGFLLGFFKKEKKPKEKKKVKDEKKETKEKKPNKEEKESFLSTLLKKEEKKPEIKEREKEEVKEESVEKKPKKEEPKKETKEPKESWREKRRKKNKNKKEKALKKIRKK